MKVFLEKEAEDLLEENGFSVINRAFARSLREVSLALVKVGVPLVMKVYSNEVIHKNKFNGIRLSVKTLSEAEYEFNNLMKIKGAKGVVFQKFFSGKEFLFGIKTTPEFGQVLVFGKGGTLVEEEKDVSFRIVPLDKKDFIEVVRETKIGKTLSKNEINHIVKNLKLLNSLAIKNPKISELDINPFILNGDSGFVVDARIVFN